MNVITSMGSRDNLHGQSGSRTMVSSNVITEGSQRYAQNSSEYTSGERIESYRNVSSRVLSGESDLGGRYIKQGETRAESREQPPRYNRNYRKQNE